MIDGERRAAQLVIEELLPILQQAARDGRLSELHVPTDDELGEDAARVWAEYHARGYAHLEPRDAFFRGYGAAVRNLYGMFGLLEEDMRVIGPVLVPYEKVG